VKIFPGCRPSEEAVVIGDAGPFFTYDLLNQAFRKITSGATFVALAKNRNFLDRDGELNLDVGPFVEGLEYASRRAATVFGNPSPMFFRLAVEALECAASSDRSVSRCRFHPCRGMCQGRSRRKRQRQLVRESSCASSNSQAARRNHSVPGYLLQGVIWRWPGAASAGSFCSASCTVK
jgi:hypothetical protein